MLHRLTFLSRPFACQPGAALLLLSCGRPAPVGSGSANRVGEEAIKVALEVTDAATSYPDEAGRESLASAMSKSLLRNTEIFGSSIRPQNRAQRYFAVGRINHAHRFHPPPKSLGGAVCASNGEKMAETSASKYQACAILFFRNHRGSGVKAAKAVAISC
jgi:hypothetical protein